MSPSIVEKIVSNMGVEFEANWREQKGEFNYNIGLNFDLKKTRSGLFAPIFSKIR